MDSTVPTQREAPEASTRPWVRSIVAIADTGRFEGSTFGSLPKTHQEELLARAEEQKEVIRSLMECARNYRLRAIRSMRLAQQARQEYLADKGTDAGLDSVPQYKGHVADNRWFMEWARVYDGQAQMEMKAFELGMY